MKSSTLRLRTAVVGLIWFALCAAIFATVRPADRESGLLSALMAAGSPAEAAFSITEADSQSLVFANDLTRVWQDPRRVAAPAPAEVTDAVLWLARCIYSETKRPLEQELVAWVVRNRVETAYRGEDTYRQVVLDSYQFSAFNPGNRKRRYFLQLDRFSEAPGWNRALAIANMVFESEPEMRPFPITTRHFFSQISMPGGRYPYWSYGEQLVTPEREYSIDPSRFRFYTDVR